MGNYEKPSKWCLRMQNEALERGDKKAATHYFEMYNQWKERGL